LQFKVSQKKFIQKNQSVHSEQTKKYSAVNVEIDNEIVFLKFRLSISEFRCKSKKITI